MTQKSILEGYGKALAADSEFMNKARAEIADLEQQYAAATANKS